MKVKVYALFRRFEAFSYEDEDTIHPGHFVSNEKFIGLFGSENAVMKEIEDRVMTEYYKACDYFDDRIELELEYGIDSGRVFDFQILEQTDDRMKYTWCGDHIATLFWETYEVDVEPEPEVTKISKEKLQAFKEIWRKYGETMRKVYTERMTFENGPKISDSDGSVR